MSCVDAGLWHFSTDKTNDIFHIVQVGAVTLEIIAILFYNYWNRSISVNSSITNRNIVINDYDDTYTVDEFGYEKMAKKIKKANKNVILPIYSKLLWLFIVYEIIMIIYSLVLLVLSINKIAINTFTKYTIIIFEGFLANFFWYTFMYLIMFSFVQKSSGTASWKRSAYFSLFLGIIHGTTFIFIFYIIHNGLTTTYITIGLCIIDILIFIFMIYFMYKHPRKRYRKSLVCYTICMFIIHIIWIVLNIIIILSFDNKSHSIFGTMSSSFCIYYIFDVIRQLTFPIILFFTLKYDSEYWSEMALSIMSSNHARLSIWDECVEYTFNSMDNTDNTDNRYSMDTSKTNLAFDEVVNVAQMQIPIFDWKCLGIDQQDDDQMNKSYLGIGTSATVLLGKYKGTNVAIKCILCDELDIETMHLFYKEALLSLSLQSKGGKAHPNIVEFLGIAIQPPELCLIYEYCSHKSLTNVLQNVSIYQNINYIQILYIAQDIAKGMKYLHKNNVVHRDLKTENVLIHQYTEKNKNYPGKIFIAKVCDFGLARKFDDDEPDSFDDEEEDDDELAINSTSSPSTSSFRSIKSIKSMQSRGSRGSKTSWSNVLFSSFGGLSNKKKKKYISVNTISVNAEKGISLLDEDGYVMDEEEEEKYKPEIAQKPQLMTTEVGTVAFLPPEILENMSFQDAYGDVKILSKNTLYAQSVDVFAFGVILWELIMRDEVYKEYKTAEDIRNAVLSGNYPKIPQWAPDDYNQIIKACWDKNPLNRPTFNFINKKLKMMIKTSNNYKNNKKLVNHHVASYDEDYASDDGTSIASYK